MEDVLDDEVDHECRFDFSCMYTDRTSTDEGWLHMLFPNSELEVAVVKVRGVKWCLAQENCVLAGGSYFKWPVL